MMETKREALQRMFRLDVGLPTPFNKDGWECIKFECVLTSDAGKTMGFDFFRGVGCKRRLRRLDVLECLTMDADVQNYDSFAGWALSNGYNPDSIKDLTTYNACMDQTRNLMVLIEGTTTLDFLREAFNQ